MRGHTRQRGFDRSGVMRWQVVVHPERGKFLSRMVRGTQADADSALRAFIAEIESGEAAVAVGTLGDLCEKWLTVSQDNGSRSRNRTDSDRAILKNHAAALTPLKLVVRRPRTDP
jgi:hypothetical protein